MQTVYKVGQTVTSRTNRQGLVEGQKYVIRYVSRYPMTWGGGYDVTYYVTKLHAGNRGGWRQVENGDIVFAPVNENK